MKLNKLLPIVALSGIATVAMPLVTSCSCGNTPEEEDGIKLDTWSESEETKNYIVTTGDNYFDVVENQEYTFLVDWTDYPSEETRTHFAISIAPQEQNASLPIDKTSIYAKIGGVVLHEFTGDETDRDAWYCDGGDLICLPKNPISKNTKIIIKTKFTNGSTNCVATGKLTNGL